MVIAYHGTIQEIHRELEEHGPAINAAYKQVFGRKNAKVIKRAVQELLSPTCYFNNQQEVKEALGQDFGEKTSNKFLVAGDFNKGLDSQGNILDKDITASCAFYIDEAAFPYSGSSQFTDRQVASYIHEFNHFVWFVLQEPPLYFANGFINMARDPKPSHYKMSMPEYLRETIHLGLPEEQMRNNLALSALRDALEEGFEKANELLDRIVLGTMGIDKPLEWRGKPKDGYMMAIPGIGMVGQTMGGDPFSTLSDQKAIERFVHWPESLRRIFSSRPYENNLLNSLKEVKIKRIPLESMLKQADQIIG